MNASDLARPEIRALRPYTVAAPPDGTLRLDANEAPRAIGNGPGQGLNRYPSVRPAALTASMARLYGVETEDILVTRGSSEGIDLLVRTFCRAGKDNVLVTPPAFALYGIYAAVQGAGTIEVPLQPERDFVLDAGAVIAACNDGTKLVFLCSPNNPVGTAIPAPDILRIVKARAGQSVVVVDEAYVEYGTAESLAPLVSTFDNLVVLRTLSKALALAGARCGAVIASAAVIRLLDSVLAPYAVSGPVIASAQLALSEQQLARARSQLARTVAERERLRASLAACRMVRRVWPSEANFLLVKFRNLPAVEKRLGERGIAVRTYANDELLRGCARITVASAIDNEHLVRAIRSLD